MKKILNLFCCLVSLLILIVMLTNDFTNVQNLCCVLIQFGLFLIYRGNKL